MPAHSTPIKRLRELGGLVNTHLWHLNLGPTAIHTLYLYSIIPKALIINAGLGAALLFFLFVLSHELQLKAYINKECALHTLFAHSY